MFYYALFTSPGRQVSNMKDELDLAVAEIAAQHPLIVIDVDSTLSSRILIDSFQRQRIPFTPKSNTLPSGSVYLHGVYGPTVATRTVNNKCATYYIDSKWSTESIRQRAYENEFPENKILSIGKNSFAYLLSILIDPMYQGFVYSSKYLSHNQLETSNGQVLADTEFWSYYVEPLLIAHHWGHSINYTDTKFSVCNTDCSKDTVYVNLNILTKFLSKPNVANLQVPDNSNLLT